ncbi:hypothetical protein LDENG_00032710 [Lucifuga dentata]|nr:hypothetical protein LDENG_00032710 [Lucifuga dentata]
MFLRPSYMRSYHPGWTIVTHCSHVSTNLFGKTAACTECCCKTVMLNQLQNSHLSCSYLLTLATYEIQDCFQHFIIYI